MRRLLIRPGAIGDCILSLPALEHLKADYTEIWAPTPVVPLIGFADSVRPLSSTGIDALAISAPLKAILESFDSILSWYGANRPEFQEALASAGIACEFHRALPTADYAGHAIDFFAEQVGAPADLIPRIEVVPSAARMSIVIHPFSGGRRKNWPLHLYRELASRLSSKVEWTAGPEEELADARRFTSLADLAAWIAGARLYIGNDSGITHLAAATGVRTLALFGQSLPNTWSPRGENVTVLREDPIEELSVESVLRAANRLLA